MRRFSSVIPFIFVCLGSVSGLDNLLHYVIDEVQAGSYKYYSLMYHGSIKIRLTTQSGDADVYVSQTTAKPTYEPDHYCLQSTTCGEDIIYIPRSFKRPVSIGVYGHPSYETSSYTLLVYQVNDLHGDVLTDENQEDDNLQGSQTPKKEKSSFIRALLGSFVDVVFHVLF